ncbi:MAG: polyprenyl synthetase family protein [Lachnospiraceae bacterium]|nr:polyprenyl synthetase family protein [Lachnospiraceae bacterium]
MYKEIFYAKENDGSLKDYQEITFLFDSNCKEPNDKVNKSDFYYQIAAIEDFYSILQNDKKVLECGGNFVFQVNTDKDLDVMIQSYQLFSFMNFFKDSKERLCGKMQNFNREICNQSEKHIFQNISEFTRMNCHGKFIRGALVNLGYSILKRDIEYSDDLALAFEIYQTAILINDDIIDHASLRRNQPTIPVHYINDWKMKGIEIKRNAYDVADSMAICAGGLGMCYANQKVAEAYSRSDNLGILLKYFNQVIINTIQGEVIDVILPFEEQNFCSNEDDLVNSITEIYRLKTAWYTVIGPLCLGMILAGGADEDIIKIENFAENLGIAFQIKDDILGIYADEDNIGKNVGSDITEFKQTLLYAYIRNQKDYFSNFLRYYGKENLTYEDVKAIRDLFSESGALAYAEHEMNRYFELAIKSLKSMKFIPKEKETILFGLIWYLKLRKF